ncbi:MAG: helix-turn-helix transcriptional regulator [Hyphomicrobiaceae bacterium]
MSEDQPVFRTRGLLPRDAAVAAGWMTEEWGLGPALGRSLEPLITALVAQDRLRGGCIEQLEPETGRWQIAAIGLSAFVMEADVARYLAEPTPFPSLSCLERARNGDPTVFLDSEAIGRANAGEGLNQLTVYYGQTVKDPADPRWRHMLPASHKLHREVHGGYRMRRLMQDEWTMNEQVFVYAGYRVLCRFQAGTACPLGVPPLKAPRSLVSITADEVAAGLPGSTASFLFEYRRPRLMLTAGERRLLLEAIAGRTDAEIAASLSLSSNTIKTTWRQIYGRFDQRLGFVLGSDSTATRTDGGRGPEKRRRVIAFVQDHLEELRPYRAG